MQELVGTLRNPSLQGKVRKAMSHTNSFRVEQDLPDDLLSRLQELDRAAARRKN